MLLRIIVLLQLLTLIWARPGASSWDLDDLSSSPLQASRQAFGVNSARMKKNAFDDLDDGTQLHGDPRKKLTVIRMRRALPPATAIRMKKYKTKLPAGEFIRVIRGQGQGQGQGQQPSLAWQLIQLDQAMMENHQHLQDLVDESLQLLQDRYYLAQELMREEKRTPRSPSRMTTIRMKRQPRPTSP